MRIIFLSKKKEEKHMRTIEKFTHMAIENYDFELGEDGMELMADFFGLKGLLYGKAMCEKRLEELQDKLMEIRQKGAKHEHDMDSNNNIGTW